MTGPSPRTVGRAGIVALVVGAATGALPLLYGYALPSEGIVLILAAILLGQQLATLILPVRGAARPGAARRVPVSARRGVAVRLGSGTATSRKLPACGVGAPRRAGVGRAVAVGPIDSRRADDAPGQLPARFFPRAGHRAVAFAAPAHR